MEMSLHNTLHTDNAINIVVLGTPLLSSEDNYGTVVIIYTFAFLWLIKSTKTGKGKKKRKEKGYKW